MYIYLCEQKACYDHFCTYIRDVLVDCTWSEWIPGQCSKTCGGGIRNDSRQMFIELYGGKPCEGETTREEQCNTNGCPGIYIYFMIPKK